MGQYQQGPCPPALSQIERSVSGNRRGLPRDEARRLARELSLDGYRDFLPRVSLGSNNRALVSAAAEGRVVVEILRARNPRANHAGLQNTVAEGPEDEAGICAFIDAEHAARSGVMAQSSGRSTIDDLLISQPTLRNSA